MPIQPVGYLCSMDLLASLGFECLTAVPTSPQLSAHTSPLRLNRDPHGLTDMEGLNRSCDAIARRPSTFARGGCKMYMESTLATLRGTRPSREFGSSVFVATQSQSTRQSRSLHGEECIHGGTNSAAVSGMISRDTSLRASRVDHPANLPFG